MRGLVNLDEVKKLIDLGAIFFVSHSGGKDSQAQMIEIERIVPKSQIVVVHADLPGADWSGTFDHIKATVGDHDLRVVVANETFMEMVTKRGMWPSPKYRQCTSGQKTGPIDVLIRAIMKERGAKYAVNCVGIRAGESDGRKQGVDKDHFKKTGEALTIGLSKRLALFEKMNHPEGKLDKKGRVKRVNNLSKPNGKRFVYDWYPIFNYSLEDLLGVVEDAGQRLHWAYAKGMSRLSCMFCIMAKKSDLRVSAKENPNVFKQYVEKEKEIGHTMFADKNGPISLEDFIGVKVDETFEI